MEEAYIKEAEAKCLRRLSCPHVYLHHAFMVQVVLHVLFHRDRTGHVHYAVDQSAVLFLLAELTHNFLCSVGAPKTAAFYRCHPVALD